MQHHDKRMYGNLYSRGRTDNNAGVLFLFRCGIKSAALRKEDSPALPLALADEEHVGKRTHAAQKSAEKRKSRCD